MVCVGNDEGVFLFSPFAKTRSNTSVTFQCELKQWSPIHQHFSQGFKDQHVILPAQDSQSSFVIGLACFIMHAGHDVVDMSFSLAYETTRVCVSQNAQQDLDQRCGHLGVYVFLMCRLFSDSQRQCWAT